jgi:excinuclease ABC subunit B
MKRALEETERRRDIQLAYNREHGIDPQPLRKKIADITDQLAREEADTAELLSKRKKDPRVKDGGRGKAATPLKKHDGIGAEGAEQLEQTIADLTQQMVQAAEQLKFELAARLRDEVSDLKSALRQMEQAGHA